MRVGRFVLRPDWGQIGFVSALMAWIVWYYFDALAASPNIQNMLLIRPVTYVTGLIYLLIVFSALNIAPADAPAPERDERPPGSARDLRAPLIALALIVYVALIPYLGFDVATALFVAAAMAAAGERRWWALLLVSIGFSAFLSLGFKFALSTPVPTLVL